MKKNNSNTQKTLLNIAVLTTLIISFSSCSNNKSNTSAATTNSQSTFDVNSSKQLASCNKKKDDHFSFNVASVVDQSGQVNSDWIKLKFNFMSEAMTAQGNTVKFFKWRVNGTSSIIDNSPMPFAAFDLSSGQTIGTTINTIPVEQLNLTTGFYINLNDPNSSFKDTSALFQVLKVVVYSTEGKIVGQSNILIPAFYANPTDYQYNSDGTARSITLQQMHPLYGTTMTGWTSTEFEKSFSAYCF